MENTSKPFWKSATKIVFILLTMALIGLTFVGKVDPKDFILIAGQAFAFYFGQKNPKNNQ